MERTKTKCDKHIQTSAMTESAGKNITVLGHMDLNNHHVKKEADL
jgi:hypothetical protein